MAESRGGGLRLRAETECGITASIVSGRVALGEPALQPEAIMSVPHSVATILREHVTWELESIDRLVRRVRGRS